MAYRKYKQMTYQDFDKIKALQKGGFTQGQTAKIIGRSWATVDLCFKAVTFSDYQARIHKIGLERKEKRMAKDVAAQNARTKTQTTGGGVTEPGEEAMPTPSSNSSKPVDIRIAEAFERMADSLEIIASKR